MGKVILHIGDKFRLWLVCLAGVGLCLFANAGCQRHSPPADNSGKLDVFVSIDPQAFFVKHIGGDNVNVEVLLKPGQSPRTFSPTARQMVRLSRANLYFRIGLPFEDRLIEKIHRIFPDLKIVDTRKGITLRRMATHHHAHDDNCTQSEGNDPHIWLSPRLVKTQARTIADALVGADPAHAGRYRENLKNFESELNSLDRRLAKTLAPLKGRDIFVFHSAYGYFADAYGLHQVPVEIEGKTPTARQLAELIDRARSAGVKVIFVQPQFSSKCADNIAKATGATVIPLDPLAQDYMQNMRKIASAVAKALDKQ